MIQVSVIFPTRSKNFSADSPERERCRIKGSLLNKSLFYFKVLFIIKENEPGEGNKGNEIKMGKIKGKFSSSKNFK